MKIMQINVVNREGSTGKIINDIHNGLLSAGIESIICYGRGKKSEVSGIYKVCGELYAKTNNLGSRITGLAYGGCDVSTKHLISIIQTEKPNVVHLHCLNGHFVNIYRLVEWLNRHRLPTVLTLHAEFMHTANCSYAFDCEKWKTGCGNCPCLKEATQSLFFDRTHTSWMKMKKAFDGFDVLTVVSVSPWLENRAKQSPILADKKHTVVLNGLNTEIFKAHDTLEMRREYTLHGEQLVFHATPHLNNDPAHIKGGYYILKLAEAMRGDNVRFVIAGNYNADLKVPENVVLLGNIKSQEKLVECYSLADLTVLASKKETFSMIVAESLCCGTPVVGFQAGAPEQIAIDQYSHFVKYGDVYALEQAVKNCLAMHYNKQEISNASHKKYDKAIMIHKYIDLYKEYEDMST